jgi:hypothetical protein
VFANAVQLWLVTIRHIHGESKLGNVKKHDFAKLLISMKHYGRTWPARAFFHGGSAAMPLAWILTPLAFSVESVSAGHLAPLLLSHCFAPISCSQSSMALAAATVIGLGLSLGHLIQGISSWTFTTWPTLRILSRQAFKHSFALTLPGGALHFHRASLASHKVIWKHSLHIAASPQPEHSTMPVINSHFWQLLPSASELEGSSWLCVLIRRFCGILDTFGISLKPWPQSLKLLCVPGRKLFCPSFLTLLELLFFIFTLGNLRICPRFICLFVAAANRHPP